MDVYFWRVSLFADKSHPVADPGPGDHGAASGNQAGGGGVVLEQPSFEVLRATRADPLGPLGSLLLHCTPTPCSLAALASGPQGP